MKHYKLSEDLTTRYTPEGGNGGHGCLVVGADHVVRWYTHEELAAMTPVGDYRAASGAVVFDDRAPRTELPAHQNGCRAPSGDCQDEKLCGRRGACSFETWDGYPPRPGAV